MALLLMQLQCTVAKTTLGEVLEFVLKHKGDKLFRFFSDQEILAILHKASRDGSLFIVNGKDGITGMVIAYQVNDNEFKVDHLLCTTKEAFQWMRKMARQRMGDRICRYVRRGKLKQLRRY